MKMIAFLPERRRPYGRSSRLSRVSRIAAGTKTIIRHVFIPFVRALHLRHHGLDLALYRPFGWLELAADVRPICRVDALFARISYAQRRTCFIRRRDRQGHTSTFQFRAVTRRIMGNERLKGVRAGTGREGQNPREPVRS